MFDAALTIERSPKRYIIRRVPAELYYRLQQIAFKNFGMPDGFCSACGGGARAAAVCCSGGLIGWLARRLGRLALLFWNCACVDAVGVATSRPPAAEERFNGVAPVAASRSRVLGTFAFPGEGGGGCGLCPLMLELRAAEASMVGVSSFEPPGGVFVCDFLAGDGPGDGVYGPPLSISRCW